VFSHWDVIHGDPFWVPKTEEELELFGEKVSGPFVLILANTPASSVGSRSFFNIGRK
jgi:hypothetical protein